jgi:hypothetical protein
MFLVGAGLFALAGRRTDREAWRWRAAIGGAGAVWAVLWGSSFLVQTRGGHSDWIPRTTPVRVVDTVTSLVTNGAADAFLVSAAVVVGGILLVRSDRRLGRVWGACFVVPVALAAVLGMLAPVLLDRTLTMTAWAPMLALALVLDAVLARTRVLGVIAIALVVVLVVPPAVEAVAASSGPDRALRRLEAVARPGDVVAVRSAGKAPEVQWTLGVRGPLPWRPVTVADISPTAAGLQLGRGAPSGRVWILDWNSRLRDAPGYERCAADQNFGVSRIVCLQREGTHISEHESPAVETQEQAALVRVRHHVVRA